MSPAVKKKPKVKKFTKLGAMRVLALAGFVVAGGSQFKVQILDSAEIGKKAIRSKKFVVTRQEIAERGEIWSSDGQRLAEPLDGSQLVIQFSKVPKSRAFYLDLASATGIPASEFALRNDSKEVATWETPLTSSQARKVDGVREKWRADGLGLRRPVMRRYELGAAGAGLVGYLRLGKPAGGLELGQDALLRGRNGQTIGMVDRDGQFLPMHIRGDSVSKQNGQRLTLTINTKIQRIAYDAVKDAVVTNAADRGVAVVMRKNGDVLALANYPSFDPSLPLPAVKPGQDSADFSPSYQATLEPGSTFKILTVAKALDLGLVTPHSSLTCNGQMEVGGRLVRCDEHHGNRAHGQLDTTAAIARSCNVSAATWALKVGYPEFVPYIEDLGLVSRPGVGLPREAKGQFNYGDVAKRLQIANVGFGQSISVSPLSLCSAFVMLANNGMTVHPRLIAKIGDRPVVSEPGKQVIHPDTAHTVLDMMRQVFESDHGTAHKLRVAGFDLGGKTGTAQKRNDKTHTMVGGGYVSNFVGFVPASEPEFVVLVMIDHPQAGKIYGADVAGPVFINITKNAVASLGIQPTNPVEDLTKAAPDGRKVGLTSAKSSAGTADQTSGPQIHVVATSAPHFDPKAASLSASTAAAVTAKSAIAPTRKGQGPTEVALMQSLLETGSNSHRVTRSKQTKATPPPATSGSSAIKIRSNAVAKNSAKPLSARPKSAPAKVDSATKLSKVAKKEATGRPVRVASKSSADSLHFLGDSLSKPAHAPKRVNSKAIRKETPKKP